MSAGCSIGVKAYTRAVHAGKQRFVQGFGTHVPRGCRHLGCLLGCAAVGDPEHGDARFHQRHPLASVRAAR